MAEKFESEDYVEPPTWYVDFCSITIDEDTYIKLQTNSKFASEWILDNAKIDSIIRA